MSVEPQRKGGDKLDLYERQINMLDTLLQHGAISEAQYQKSAGDLEKLMFPQAFPVTVFRRAVSVFSVAIPVSVPISVAVSAA